MWVGYVWEMRSSFHSGVCKLLGNYGNLQRSEAIFMLNSVYHMYVHVDMHVRPHA